VGRLLEEFLERQQLDSGVLFYRIREIWRDVVGPVSAARSVPVSLRDHTLTVAVADSAWLQELSYLKGDFLQRIQRRVGEEAVQGLRFVVRPGAATPEPQEEPRESPGADEAERPLPPEVTRALDAFEDQLDTVEDPDLRRSIRKAFLADLLRAQPRD
jgi:hypothetical protein